MGLALLDAHQHAHLHQAGVGRLAGAPAVDDVGHIPAPRREIGEHVVDQPVEQLGIGGVGMVVAALFLVERAHFRAERLARGLALGHVHRVGIGVLVVLIGAAAVVLDELVDDPLLGLTGGVNVGAHDAEGHQIDVHIIAPEAIGGIGIARERQQLRVRNDGVPRLHERLGDDLPVGGDFLGHPDDSGAFLVAPAFEMLRQRREVFLKARPALLLAQEDVAAPAPDLGLGQLQLFGGQVLEIPRAGHAGKAAVLVPGKAVERALEAVGAAIVIAQLAPAVEADVVERAHAAVILPRDDPRAPGNLEHGVITGLGNILLARGELPDIGPHPLALQPGEILAGVLRRGDRRGSQIFVRIIEQHIGRRPRIQRHQRVPADRRTARQSAADGGVTLGHNANPSSRTYALPPSLPPASGRVT